MRIAFDAGIQRAIRHHEIAQRFEPLLGRRGAHAVQQLVEAHERERERRALQLPLARLRAPSEVPAQLAVVHDLVRGEIMLERALVLEVVLIVRRELRLADEQPVARFEERSVLALKRAKLLEERRKQDRLCRPDRPCVRTHAEAPARFVIEREIRP